MNTNTQPAGRARLDRVLLCLLLPGLFAALWLAAGRYSTESRNKAVELTIDYSEMQILSASSGVPISELLAKFKAAGVTGLAITEDTIGSYTATNQASYSAQETVSGTLTNVWISDQSLAKRVFPSLNARLAPELIQPGAGPGGYLFLDGHAKLSHNPLSFRYRTTPSVLNGLGIGLPTEAVKAAETAGLDVVARLQNSPVMTKRAIDASIGDLKKQGVTRLIFSGEEVLGFKGLVKYAAEKIESEGMTYGSVEFGKQKGDTGMSTALKSNFVRVHSIPGAELAGMTPATAAERFARAAKERNIRLCYMRLPDTVGENPVDDGIAFVTRIRAEIEEAGYSIGHARPFDPLTRSRGPLVLIGLSIAAGTVLLLNSLFTMSAPAKYGLLVIGAILGAGLTLGPEKGIQALALLSALVFPTLGAVALLGPYFKGDIGEKRPLGKTVLLFIGVSAFSLYGALMIIGLMADRSYMVKIVQFSGIKLAHLLPLVGVVMVMAAGLPIHGKPFSKVKSEVTENIRRLISNPLFVWHALAVFFALAVVGFALMRTGNDPGVGVSGLELKMRAVLDKILFVRPRTKEFMIGHPALLLGIGLLLTRRRAWGLPLIAFGMLGQVSLLNTFCHIHTPLALSAWRAGNGLALGILIGVAAWVIFIRKRSVDVSSTRRM